ncbi:MAG: hypothetical protein IJ870_05120 [Alphaproteobacteria bacterium]|nr:hypothetical protein [Alphaproteobacteria bacterium]
MNKKIFITTALSLFLSNAHATEYQVGNMYFIVGQSEWTAPTQEVEDWYHWDGSTDNPPKITIGGTFGLDPNVLYIYDASDDIGYASEPQAVSVGSYTIDRTNRSGIVLFYGDYGSVTYEANVRQDFDEIISTIRNLAYEAGYEWTEMRNNLFLGTGVEVSSNRLAIPSWYTPSEVTLIAAPEPISPPSDNNDNATSDDDSNQTQNIDTTGNSQETNDNTAQGEGQETAGNNSQENAQVSVDTEVNPKRRNKRIYTVEEASKVSKPTGNKFRLRYK